MLLRFPGHRVVAYLAESNRHRDTDRRVVRPCGQLPIIREEVDIGVEGVFWESVEIQNCQNGYARVFAFWGGTPPPGSALEASEQVFLQDVGGMWSVLTSGSGIACSDKDLMPELEEACRALGLA